MKTSDATLQDIADTCGVTVMTVTRALKPGSPVATATRDRVMQAIERLGYRPRPNFGRPRTATAPPRTAVDVILCDLQATASVFKQGLITTISRELGRRNRDCVIRMANDDQREFLALCECMRADRELPTMIVGYLPARQLEILLAVRPNAVLVDHTGDPAVAAPCHSIGFDNLDAARQMTRHLLDAGRRRILLVNGFADHYFARELAQGHHEALAERGLEPEPQLHLATDFTQVQASAAVDAAIGRGLAFDAVLSNDEMAMAIMHTLQRRGRRVPEDVAVAGIDGLPLGAYLVPALTTVLLDYDVLGRLAVACVCDEADTTTTPIRRRLLPHLCVRDSTKER